MLHSTQNHEHLITIIIKDVFFNLLKSAPFLKYITIGT